MPGNKTPTHSRVLILCPLLAEAQPIIEHLGLTQYETRPFRVFRGAEKPVLLVTGVGGSAVEAALDWLFGAASEHAKRTWHTIILAGTAAAPPPRPVPRDPSDQSLGEPVFVLGQPVLARSCRREITLDEELPITCPLLGGVLQAALITVDQPLTDWAGLRKPGIGIIADMEGWYAARKAAALWPEARFSIVRVVSDYGDSNVPPKEQTRAYMAGCLDTLDRLVSVLTTEPGPGIHTGIPATKESVVRTITRNRAFPALDPRDAKALEIAWNHRRFSFQELRQVVDWAADLRSWDEVNLEQAVSRGICRFEDLRRLWRETRDREKSYTDFTGMELATPKHRRLVDRPQDALALGDCPVASAKTRCCNLKTLDVIQGCGFDCSYCAIRTFYDPGRVVFDPDFPEKLAALELDKHKSYHIGTGQSSDSLLWAERNGALDALLDFARRHPRVILELKTKSGDVSALLTRPVPANLVCTWSLNTPVIIDHEEQGTASLDQRLDAARSLADRGVLVGFHLHPMVWYRGWQEDYAGLCRKLRARFVPGEVVMVSLGTLTFTKPVIKALRKSLIRSKILQMPMENAQGKLSYPLEIKEQLFSLAYHELANWHREVYFYLCMEDPRLWTAVMGREYPDNPAFEEDMLTRYGEKISMHSAGRTLPEEEYRESDRLSTP